MVTSRPLGIGWTLGLGLALAVGCSGPTEMELVELEIGTPAEATNPGPPWPLTGTGTW